ncbi:MAG: hypothetical protein DHS20C15_19320 [Planctomycetota bacterium]|nr:MAG: hypothetical protein DHS20C15_19320 [Planctomycetota bacterium]
MDPTDLPLDENVQVEPGVVARRRCFLKTAALALGAVSLPGFAPLRLGQTADASLPLDQFLAEVGPVARELVKDTSRVGQDRYLLTLASYAVRLTQVRQPKFRASEQGDGVMIGSNGTSGPFTVLQWKMTPGAEIRGHAHTYGNVVTLGLAGVALVRNYEVLGEPDFDSTESFRVRRTLSQRLSPRATNLVSLERNYIHGFKAGPKGARGLDITTRLGEQRPTPYMELEKSSGGASDVFSARWSE